MDIEALQRRREERRRAIRHRRRNALVAFALVLAIVVVVVLLSRSGSSNDGTRTGHAQAGSADRATRSRSSSGASHGAVSKSGTPGGGVATGRPGADAVPILMYHVIAPAPAGAPFPGLYVTPQDFSAQMHALERAGWTAVTQDQVQAYWRSGISLPRGKPIVVSFDNGYQSQYTQALPVLRSLGWAGEENIQLTGLPPSQGGLSRRQVRGLLAAGWELDTQGISHADLITLDATQLREQTAGARRTLQRRYGVPVDWFCYPSGHYDAAVVAAVKAAGFVGATTVVPGWARPSGDRYRLPRLRVLGGTSAQSLLSEIAAIRDDSSPPASYNGR
ncbi:MAG TPA: polysaccharide deacetylase family protein [Solirubrobacteraceae bacterium]|jgi:peptidoglycan/xylan/chitin deacetylase (PgdA/CDA1 family)|nr:polysaccharide deacetylase family protein [Solirubrobacteraceae bacterium]